MALLTASAPSSAITLESLPSETQAHMLSILPDFETLHSMLHASPRFLQVYRSFRRDVNSNIVYNRITPALVPLAVDALQQRSLRSDPRRREKVLAFLETFKQSTSALAMHEFSLETLRQLLKTHAMVESLADRFIRERLSWLSEYFPQVQPLLTQMTASKNIFGIEHQRLVRALYHIELYGHLFHVPGPEQDTYSDDDTDSDDHTDFFDHTDFVDRDTDDGTYSDAGTDADDNIFTTNDIYAADGITTADYMPHDIFTVQEQSSLFLAKLPNWELEELWCVHEYLLDLQSVYVDRVNADFLQSYIDKGPPANILEATFQFDLRWIFDRSFYFFSAIGDSVKVQDRWMEGSVTRGLDALRDMWEAGTAEERGNLLGKVPGRTPRVYLKHALEAVASVKHQTEPSLYEIEDMATSIDSLQFPNHGWLWASKQWPAHRTNNPRSVYYLKYRYYDTRSWGFAIWGNEFLNASGLIEEPQHPDHDNVFYRVTGHSGAKDLPSHPLGKDRRLSRVVEGRSRQVYTEWRMAAFAAALRSEKSP